MADFEDTVHLVVDFLRKYSYVELAQALELEACMLFTVFVITCSPAYNTINITTLQARRYMLFLLALMWTGLLRKGLLWERTDDLAFKTNLDEDLSHTFALGTEESRNMTRSQPSLPILDISAAKKEAKEIKRRGFSRAKRSTYRFSCSVFVSKLG
jgi:hypothetical protein